MTGEMLGNSRVERRSTSRWRQGASLRHGYTTAACAAAAATAAARMLLGDEPASTVSINLPAEEGARFAVAALDVRPGSVTCSTIKDAGDDPDVTHGAEIRATVEWSERPGVTIRGGIGVGIVTRPGLPVSVGEAAINPGARRLIASAVNEAAGQAMLDRGLLVTISVPNGQALAEQTLNPRLGIVGGISILGADGIVRPYSNTAYRATIRLALRVASRNGADMVILATGSRSEEHARARYPEVAAMAFVQVGDHMDCALREARRLQLGRATIATMIGKASKLAQGRMQTHVSEGPVDLAALAQTAAEVGADEALQARVRAANTVHHAQNLLRAAGVAGLEQRLAELAANRCLAFTEGAVPVAVLIFALDGALLGYAEAGGSA